MNSIKNSKKILALSAAVGMGLLAATFVFADTDTMAPSVPTGLTATAVSTSQINLSWATSTDNVGVAGYVVSKNGVQIATTTTMTYSSMGLTASTTYAYTVSAFDAAGNTSASSVSVSATTMVAALDTTSPSIPGGLAASPVFSSQINLSWVVSTDAVGVTGYRVFRGGGQIATTSATSYSDIGLSASTTYMYAVSAFDAAGNTSAQSPTVSATTLGVTTTPPPVPQPRVKPEEISINPNGHVTIHGMTVTGVGTNSFTGTIWGITYVVQYRETSFGFLFKDGHNGTSTGQIHVGDEMGVMGVITHDVPMTIQAQVIRDYSLIKARPEKHDNENGNNNEGNGKGNNENDNGNGHGNGSNGNGNGNGNGKNDQDIRNAIQQILNKINELQGRLNGSH